MICRKRSKNDLEDEIAAENQQLSKDLAEKLTDEWQPAVRVIQISLQTRLEIKQRTYLDLPRAQYRVAKKRLQKEDFGRTERNTSVPINGDT
ncbi:MAG: hypothetical protein EZS28_002727 [Streblomastix strix]|uniref:Uncharacterized protein n=1 Tax=Streblomastix strix TaxID=222440 RepID=A0A5J4X527_9EUKA|nr:MAG: hypothetical protein EZS28_002727 [Streblomastix strix]